MTIATIGPEVIIAALLGVAMEWIPGAREWWTAMASARKAQLMAAAIAVVTVGLALLRCYAYDGVCPADWRLFWSDVAVTFLIALAANQGAHSINRTFAPNARSK